MSDGNASMCSMFEGSYPPINAGIRAPRRRSCPDELRPYENYDAEILPLALALGRNGPFLVEQLAGLIERPRTRAALSRWIAASGWRGLIFKHGSIGNRRLWSVDRDLCQQRVAEIDGSE